MKKTLLYRRTLTDSMGSSYEKILEELQPIIMHEMALMQYDFEYDTVISDVFYDADKEEKVYEVQVWSR